LIVDLDTPRRSAATIAARRNLSSTRSRIRSRSNSAIAPQDVRLQLPL